MIDKHENQQQNITSDVFKDVSETVTDEKDSLISNLLDKITIRKAEMVEQIKKYDELEDRYNDVCGKLEKSEKARVRMGETLMLVGRSAAMPVSEVILQDLAQCARDYANRRDEEITMLRKELASRDDDLETARKRIKDLERRDAANDAGSTPTSRDTITQKQINAKKRKMREEEKRRKNQGKNAKRGPPLGHEGAAREFNPDRNIDCTLDACPGCGNEIRELPGDYYKSMIEIENNVALEFWCHVHMYMCSNCGVIESKPKSMLSGTSIGKDLLIKIVQLTRSAKSGSDICGAIRVVYEKTLSRDTIKKALRVAGDYMTPGYADIHWQIANGTTANPDETVANVGGDRTWRIWVMVGDKKWVMYYIAPTRAKTVLETVFPFPYLLSTNDAYAVYKSFFDLLQLCWAHVKTKLENAVAKYDTPESRYLYGQVMDIFHHAKTLPPDTPEADIDQLISEVKRIGQQFLDLGIKAGTYLINCADHLFTAVTHPEMSFTNNLAERVVRYFVMVRNAIYWFATESGAHLFCVIASNLATWRLQNRDAKKELRILFDRPSCQQEETAVLNAEAAAAAMRLPVLSTCNQLRLYEPPVLQSTPNEPPTLLLPPARPMLPYITPDIILTATTATATAALSVLAPRKTFTPPLQSSPLATQTPAPHKPPTPLPYIAPAPAPYTQFNPLQNTRAKRDVCGMNHTIYNNSKVHFVITVSNRALVAAVTPTTASQYDAFCRCRAPQSTCTGPDTGKGPPNPHIITSNRVQFTYKPQSPPYSNKNLIRLHCTHLIEHTAIQKPGRARLRMFFLYEYVITVSERMPPHPRHT